MMAIDRNYWRNLSTVKALVYIFFIALMVTIIFNLLTLYLHPERAVQLIDYFGLPPLYMSTDFACKDVCNVINYSHSFSNVNMCKPGTDILFLVISTHSNRARRDVIRNTWGSVNHLNNGMTMQVLFVLGVLPYSNSELAYKIEKKHHHDILVFNITDSYVNLTNKTGLAFNWVSNFCSSPKFIIKTDDDSFMNPFSLLEGLSTMDHTEDVIQGECASGIRPYRDPRHKWFVPESAFSASFFPLYLRGRGYILTQNVIGKLLESAKFVRTNGMEDVFWTGLCRLKANIKVSCLHGYAITDEHETLDQCAVTSKTIFNIHHVTKEQMEMYWSWLNSKHHTQCEHKAYGSQTVVSYMAYASLFAIIFVVCVLKRGKHVI